MSLCVLGAREGMLWVFDSDPAPKILSEVVKEAQEFWQNQMSNGWPYGLLRLFCLARPVASTPPEFYIFAGYENGSSQCYYRAEKAEDINQLNRYYELLRDKNAVAALQGLNSLSSVQALNENNDFSGAELMAAMAPLEREKEELRRREVLLAEEESVRESKMAGLEISAAAVMLGLL